jgi:allophanate hydrolase subunit 2
VTPFLGSAATHILSGLGGFEGRPLRKGDLVRIGSPASEGKAGRKSAKFRERRIAPRVAEVFLHRSVLRVTAGPQADWFSEAALRAFCAETYRVGEQSNRMGLRLEGASGVGGSVALTQLGAPEMITEGVSLGAIQVPAGGAPIILFVEQQTTGGYPKIANVIAADMHRVGQLRPRDEVRFELVSFETARSLLLEQEKLLASQEWILE